MKMIMTYATFDGVSHITEEKALKHLDVLYANEMATVASKLVQIDKYHDMQAFIDKNLNMFKKLGIIKSDKMLDAESPEEDN